MRRVVAGVALGVLLMVAAVRVVVRAAVVGGAVTAEVVGLDVTSAEMVFVIKQWWGDL